MSKAKAKSVTKGKGQSPDFLPNNKSFGNPVGKDPNPSPGGSAEPVPSKGTPDWDKTIDERGYKISGACPTVKSGGGEAVDQGHLASTMRKTKTEDSGF